MSTKKVIHRFLCFLGFAKTPALSLDDREWQNICTGFSCLRRLDHEERQDLRALAADFVAHKQFLGRGPAEATLEAPGGTTLRWSIAALACLPVLRLGLDCYKSWKTIILVPSCSTVKQYRDEGAGTVSIVSEYDDEIAGEILPWGPVVLSIEDIQESMATSKGRPSPRMHGYNVVIHEMAHKLDLLNGDLDACPDLPRSLRGEWASVFGAAWAGFTALLDQPRSRRRLPLDEYAGESPEEFFAVVVEEFFERPLHLLRTWPDVYRLLAAYFGQDPAGGTGKSMSGESP